MLESILIKNYAIIESIELDFHNGFNIITGETGAGKSILLGALGLILGKRADTQVLRNKEEKCIIEAKFDIQQLQIESFFEENELEFERQCIIRREIQPNGKSRAFINDTPVNLSQLQELSNSLVDIHAQGETQKLLDEYFFCSILDKLAGQVTDTENYYHQFLEYKQLNKKLHQIQSEREQLQHEYDFNLFIYKEFEQIDLAEYVYNNLEQEIDIQQNAELIIQNLRSIEKLLDENEYSVIPQLIQSNKLLQSIAGFGSSFSEAKEQMEQIIDNLKTIYKDLNNEAEKIEYSPERLEELQDKYNTYNRLMQKHQVKDITALQEIKKSYEEKINQYNHHDELLIQINNEINILKNVLQKQAQKLSKNRISKIPDFEQSLSTILQQIGMPFAQVKFEVITGNLNEKGTDTIRFLFSPNKGVAVQSLQQVGSGGEKSRLMLAIKSLSVQAKASPTMIFDEIDTGISGEVANKVALLLKEIGKNHQIIAITHLPQVAAKADHHYFVYKKHDKAVTYTNIKELNKEERIQEIAIMLSGENPNEAAIANAKILMQ